MNERRARKHSEDGYWLHCLWLEGSNSRGGVPSERHSSASLHTNTHTHTLSTYLQTHHNIHTQVIAYRKKTYVVHKIYHTFKSMCRYAYKQKKNTHLLRDRDHAQSETHEIRIIGITVLFMWSECATNKPSFKRAHT